MSADATARALAHLQRHHVMTLATHGGQGVWAAALFYVNDGLTLYFLSSPTTRHCTDLSQSARVAVTVQEDCADWREIKGLQAEGCVCEISGDEEVRARQLYGDKFPVVGKIAQAPAAIVKALARVRWYRFVPQRAYFIDNSAGFGHRDELDCGTESRCR
jgi:uncharacterized protein YhbP (UPF0306 family)